MSTAAEKKKEMPEKILAVNISGEKARFKIAGNMNRIKEYELAPGESVPVATGYLTRYRRSEHTEVVPSIIEKLTNGRVVPETDPKAQLILRKGEKGSKK